MYVDMLQNARIWQFTINCVNCFNNKSTPNIYLTINYFSHFFQILHLCKAIYPWKLCWTVLASVERTIQTLNHFLLYPGQTKCLIFRCKIRKFCFSQKFLRDIASWRMGSEVIWIKRFSIRAKKIGPVWGSPGPSRLCAINLSWLLQSPSGYM